MKYNSNTKEFLNDSDKVIAYIAQKPDKGADDGIFEIATNGITEDEFFDMLAKHFFMNGDLVNPATPTFHQVTINCADSDGDALQHVTVWIHNENDDDAPQIAQGFTGYHGNAKLMLPNGTYTVRAYLWQRVFARHELIVSGKTTMEIIGTEMVR